MIKEMIASPENIKDLRCGGRLNITASGASQRRAEIAVAFLQFISEIVKKVMVKNAINYALTTTYVSNNSLFV